MIIYVFLAAIVFFVALGLSAFFVADKMAARRAASKTKGGRPDGLVVLDEDDALGNPVFADEGEVPRLPKTTAA